MGDHDDLLVRAEAAIVGLKAVDELLPRRRREYGHALLLEASTVIGELADNLTGATRQRRGSFLAVPIAAGDTVIRVTDTSDWPTQGFEVVIDDTLVCEERVRIDSRDGNTLFVADGMRGINGTIASAHATGAYVSLR